MDQRISELIYQNANSLELDPKVVAAIVWQESGGNPWAFRYEDGFYRKYLLGKERHQLLGHVPLPVPTLESEKRTRAMSWGLMQIMGETAREQGFKAQYLSTLCLPEENLRTGCTFFKKLLEKSESLEEKEAYKKALLMYNGGGDIKYPDIILGHIISGNYKNVLEAND